MFVGRFRAVLAVVVLASAFIVITPGVAAAAPPTITQFTASTSAPNVVTLTWNVTGATGFFPVYIYGPRTYSHNQNGFGPVADDVGAVGLSGTASFHVNSGQHTYLLVASNSTGSVSASQTVTINPPTLTLTSANPMYVSYFGPSNQTLAWTTTADKVKISKPNGTTVFSTTGSYSVDKSEFPNVGTYTYQLTPCVTTSESDFCGETTFVNIVVTGGVFDGDYRSFVTHPGSDVTVTWNGPTGSFGNFWYVDAPQLGIFSAPMATHSYTIPNTALPSTGFVDVQLHPCVFVFGVSKCPDLYDVQAGTAGTLHIEVLPGSTPPYPSTEIGYIATASGNVPVNEPSFNPVRQWYVANGATVSATQNVAQLTNGKYDEKQLVVNSPVTWTTQSWTTDFDPSQSRYVETAPLDSTGNPLDVTIEDNGDIWSGGEAASAFVQIHGAAVSSHYAPLDRPIVTSMYDFQGGAHTVLDDVRPFAGFNNVGRTDLGATEHVIEANGKIWFAQAGYGGSSSDPAYSRIISFDPNATDQPQTQTDERMCAYNIPAANSAVQGMAWDGTRMWFTESGSAGANYISWFKPSALACDNFLDYSANNYSPTFTYPVCGAGAGDNDPCFHRVQLPSSFTGPTHLVYDATRNAIWFGDFHFAIGRLDIATNTVTTYPTPTDSRHGFGPLPWQMRVQGNYVYYIESNDSDIGRIDATRTPSDCTTLVADQNPCITEVHLPVPETANVGHSIDISGNRLYWTSPNDFKTGLADTSIFGYIDLTTFASGVVYTGLPNDMVSPIRRPEARASYGGIALGANGHIALADYGRRQVIELVPR